MKLDTNAARDKWAMDRLTSMLTSGIKSASEADWSHQSVGNKDTARAWRNLAIRLELLHDLVASGLFDRIKAGGPEWDAIKVWRESRDAESETPLTAADMSVIFGEPVEGRDYHVVPQQTITPRSLAEIQAMEAAEDQAGRDAESEA